MPQNAAMYKMPQNAAMYKSHALFLFLCVLIFIFCPLYTLNGLHTTIQDSSFIDEMAPFISHGGSFKKSNHVSQNENGANATQTENAVNATQTENAVNATHNRDAYEEDNRPIDCERRKRFINEGRTGLRQCSRGTTTCPVDAEGSGCILNGKICANLFWAEFGYEISPGVVYCCVHRGVGQQVHYTTSVLTTMNT